MGAGDRGWRAGKFVVLAGGAKLADDEIFVLRPDRDPAAVAAIVAYARSTADVDLANHLREWADRAAAGLQLPDQEADPSPSWIATLVENIEAGRISAQTALVRLARLMRPGR